MKNMNYYVENLDFSQEWGKSIDSAENYDFFPAIDNPIDIDIEVTRIESVNDIVCSSETWWGAGVTE